jgi:hypothetical protein
LSRSAPSIEVKGNALWLAQGSRDESIIGSCVAAFCLFNIGAIYLRHDIASLGFAVLSIATLGCCVLVVWNAAVYEVIQIKGAKLVVDLKLAKGPVINRRTFIIDKMRGLRLKRHRVHRKRDAFYWTVAFDYEGIEKQLETRYRVEQAADHVVELYLRPMLLLGP